MKLNTVSGVVINVPDTNDVVSLIYNTTFTKGGKTYPLVLCKRDVTSAATLVQEALNGKSNTQEYPLSIDRQNGCKRSIRLVGAKLEFCLRDMRGNSDTIVLSQAEIKKMLGKVITDKRAAMAQLNRVL